MRMNTINIIKKKLPIKKLAAVLICAFLFIGIPQVSYILGTASGAVSDQVINALVYADSSMTALATEETVQLRGVLPTGGYAVAYPVDVASDTGDVLAAFDITVYTAGGTVFEPDSSVTVNIGLPNMPTGLTDGDLSLVYVPTDGAPQALDTPVSITDGGVSFDAPHFSTYAVVVTGAGSYTVSIDGGAAATTTWTTKNSTNYLDKYETGTVYSTYPDEVHTVTFSSANSNITFDGIVVDGTAVSPASANNPASASASFTDSAVIVLKYHNNNAVNVSVTFDITVIKSWWIGNALDDTVLQNGLISLGEGALNLPDAVKYTWYESLDGGVTYTEDTNSQAIFPGFAPDGTTVIPNKSLNVAIDAVSDVAKRYKVSATLSGGEEIWLGSYQVPYYNAIMNGSFELPSAALIGSSIIPQASVPNWNTTEDDAMIELWASGFTPGVPGKITFNAHSGTFFAELNANSEGTLYQDVLVTPGENLHWTLAHMGRNGPDTMHVVIMPANQVPDGITSDQAKAITATSDGSTSVTSITDTNTTVGGVAQWNSNNGGEDYEGNYTVPNGIYVVRFFFVNVSNTGAAATGNLVDDITFSAKMSYKIEYYLDDEDTPTFTYNSPLTAPGTLITADGIGAPDYSMYTLQKTKLNGIDFKKDTSFDLLAADSVLQVYYVTSGVVAYKTVDGVKAADMPGSYTAVFNLYDNDVDPLHIAASASVTLTGGNLTDSVQFKAADGKTPYQLVIDDNYTMTEGNRAYLQNAVSGYTYDVTSGPPVNFRATAGVNEVYFTNSYQRNPSIGDTVWLDSNGDGMQNNNEPNFTTMPVTVNLLDDGGNLLKTTQTDENGNYLFTDLTAGNYMVEFVLPPDSGYRFSPGVTESVDPNTGTVTGRTDVIALGTDDNMDADAGLYPASSIGDTVWLDSNKNGVRDSGEKGLSGVTVNLLDEHGQIIASQITDQDGTYQFTGLKAGMPYRVQFMPLTGFEYSTIYTDGTAAGPVTTDDIVLAAGEALDSADAGLYALNVDFTFIKESPDKQPLADVEFSLYSLADPAEPISETVADEPGNSWYSDTPQVYTSAADGTVALSLTPDTDYMLVETKTNPGYQLPTGQWLIRYDLASGKMLITNKGEEPPPTFQTGDGGEYILFNYKSVPITGISGETARAVTVFGTGLLAFGAPLSVIIRLVRKQRRENGRHNK